MIIIVLKFLYSYLNVQISISVGYAKLKKTHLNKSVVHLMTTTTLSTSSTKSKYLFRSSVTAWGQTTDGSILKYDVEEASRNAIEKNSECTIAIGMGITSKKLPLDSIQSTLHRTPFLTLLIPSFCDTMTANDFSYHFYLGYDKTDPFFSKREKRKAFREKFQEIILRKCPRGHDVYLNMYQCSHNGKPTWAQNDVMMQAYLDNITYFYRVNDDSSMTTRDWATKLVNRLKSYDPKFVGVTAPKHRGGAETILTYDFVHKTHIDIWGFYYNRIFPDWYGDDWITKIYRPGRSTQVNDVKLIHKTSTVGTRYKQTVSLNKILVQTIKRDIDNIFSKYLQARSSKLFHGISNESKYVISYAMWRDDPGILYGIMRNCQLLPVFYPEWSIYVYVPPDDYQSEIMARFIRRIHLLPGVKIKRVSKEIFNLIEPQLWNLLVLESTELDIFLTRSPYHRINERERNAVNHFLRTDKDFHCMRDHPNHTLSGLTYGLFGGRVKRVQKILTKPIVEFMKKNTKSEVFENLWQLMKSQDIICHDDFSCRTFEKSINFPERRRNHEHVGENYNMHNQALPQDAASLHLASETVC